jgi:hypothetical protein
MKVAFVSIVFWLAALSAHAMPVLLLNEAQSVIRVADRCGDRCGAVRSYSRYQHAYRSNYVLVRDPLLQRHPFCPFGSYVACVNSGAFCIDLCH